MIGSQLITRILKLKKKASMEMLSYEAFLEFLESEPKMTLSYSEKYENAKGRGLYSCSDWAYVIGRLLFAEIKRRLQERENDGHPIFAAEGCRSAWKLIQAMAEGRILIAYDWSGFNEQHFTCV